MTGPYCRLRIDGAVSATNTISEIAASDPTARRRASAKTISFTGCRLISPQLADAEAAGAFALPTCYGTTPPQRDLDDLQDRHLRSDGVTPSTTTILEMADADAATRLCDPYPRACIQMRTDSSHSLVGIGE
jgi:hypothetical protein